jgi:4-diphosphocytidyl-2-C-methyl-D-erythritol kinase
MKRVAASCHTRVTLALDIVNRIESGPHKGFHALSVIKHAISLHDVLFVEDSPIMRILCDDPRVPKDASNICWKVTDILKREFGISRNVAITIDKRIPVQGGLAGGSADAAGMFLLLRDLWNLDVGAARLAELARAVGMDVPFYFTGGTALDTEAGGVIEPIPTPCVFHLILVTPDFGVSTAEAYKDLDYSLVGRGKNDTLSMRAHLTRGDAVGAIAAMHNDFEFSVFLRHPALGDIKRRLLNLGCANAVLSGSGSTVIGVLDSPEHFERIKGRVGHASILVSSCPDSVPDIRREE